MAKGTRPYGPVPLPRIVIAPFKNPRRPRIYCDAMGIFGTPQEQVDLDHLKSRVTKLEHAVAQLQAQLATGTGGVPYGDAMPTTGTGQPPGAADWMSEVHALVASGNKIQAIKVYRERTGLGLKEAKDAVEAL